MHAESGRIELQKTYHDMTDEQLAELALDVDTLSETAFEVLRDEVRTRGAEKINTLADAMEKERFRDYCAGLSAHELELIARGGAHTEEWERAELNRQLVAQGLGAMEVIPGTQNATRSAEDQGPLVSVGKYRDLPDAQVAQSVLNSAGIPTFLADENTVRMDWMWSNLLGGIKLQVRASDAAAAQSLLDEQIGEFTEDVEEAHNEGSDGL